MFRLSMIAAATGLALGAHAAPPPAVVAPTLEQDARTFGAREALRGVALSPDGQSVSFLSPLAGSQSALEVLDTRTGEARNLLSDIHSPFSLRRCDWKGNAHLICALSAISYARGSRLAVGRTVVVPVDGSRITEIGAKANDRSLGLNQFSGTVIDRLPDDPGSVLMAIQVEPEYSTGTLLAETREGLSVQRVTLNGHPGGMVEQPLRGADSYITDGKGHVRVMASITRDERGVLGRTRTWRARAAGDSRWRTIGTYDMFAGGGLDIEAVEDGGDWLIGTRTLNGRRALYRIAADGSGREELLFASDKVDVDGVLRIGRYHRPVAAAYSLDAPEFHYFDPGLAKLAAGLARALPDRPIVTILDESDGGAFTLVHAQSANTPGKFYRYDAATHRLAEVLGERPGLDHRAPGVVRAVTYPAADGASVPAYLTLPPGVTQARGLPALLLPHGGPAARDTLGFDWLAQFFAARGYAVLQPNFRGSAGYGNGWFAKNGWQSWRVAIGDVNAGARWLIAQGIADPKRMGIFGWSYGGYAALQAGATEPDLYKAVVAVAPVTDLRLLKTEAEQFTNEDIEKAEIGDGPHLTEGSPAMNARRITAPVLLFHGDQDINVDIAQSRRMMSALRGAGHPADLVVFPGLDHQLADGEARATMLARAGAFLDKHLGAASPANAKGSQ